MLAFRIPSAAGGHLPHIFRQQQRGFHAVQALTKVRINTPGCRGFAAFFRSSFDPPLFPQKLPGEANQTLPDISAPADVGSLNPVAESVSSLAEAGLGTSWSPVSLVQHGYFELHNTLGLPWWATVMVGVFCARVMLLPAQMWALKTATRIHNNLPEELDIQRSMVKAAQDRNQASAMENYQRLREFYKQHNIAPLKPLRSAAVNLPITVTAVFSLLEMTKAQPPLTGMTSGGLLWWSDLTVGDPFFIMPICCSLLTVANISVGAETGVKPVAKTRKLVWTAMPVGVFLVASCVPSSLQLYWVVNMALSMAVSRLVKTKPVRSLLGMPEWIAHPKAVMVRAEGTGVASFTSDFKQAMRTAEAVSLKHDEKLIRSRWAAKLEQNQKFHEKLVAAARIQTVEQHHLKMDQGRTVVRPRKEDLEETELLYDEMEKPYMKRPGSRKGPPRSKP